MLKRWSLSVTQNIQIQERFLRQEHSSLFIRKNFFIGLAPKLFGGKYSSWLFQLLFATCRFLLELHLHESKQLSSPAASTMKPFSTVTYCKNLSNKDVRITEIDSVIESWRSCTNHRNRTCGLRVKSKICTNNRNRYRNCK